MSRRKGSIGKQTQILALKDELTDRIRAEFKYSITDDVILTIKTLAMNGNNNYAIACGLGVTEATLYNWFKTSPSLREYIEVNRGYRDTIANNSLTKKLAVDGYLAFQYLQKRDKALQSTGGDEKANNLTQINISIDKLNSINAKDIDALLKDKLSKTE